MVISNYLKISLVTPSYNQGQYLEQCIDSVLSQNYPALEYIIMDGGSTDNSLELIEKHEKHITYWRSLPDGGHYSAINEGFSRSHGDILCWLNSDDMLHPGALHVVAAVFTQFPEIEWITGKRIGFDSEGKLLSYGFERQIWSREVLLSLESIDKNLFVMQEATFWRRELWNRVGSTLNESINLAADFDLWVRFSQSARLYTVDALLGGYRMHSLNQRSQEFREEYIEQCRYVLDREQEGSTEKYVADIESQSIISVQKTTEKVQLMIKHTIPRVSIITPSYNQAEFLGECIDSILSQNYPNLEYVIMDGGSTDGSIDIIKKYEKHLSYWQSQPDGGQYSAINEGFKKTSGEIMAWLNSDDKYHPGALFKVAWLFSGNPDVEWLTGRPTIWGSGGECIHIEQRLPTYCRQNFLDGRYNQPFVQQESTFWRRSLWHRAGGYLRSDLNYAGDLELWLRFFRYALLFSADTFLGGYRSYGNQKAQLHMDCYEAEAESVLTEERKLYSEGGHPEAPTPLVFDAKAYREFLACSCKLDKDITQESVQQQLIKQLSQLADEVGIVESVHAIWAEKNILDLELKDILSSRSWRITKPLRWLGDKLRL